MVDPAPLLSLWSETPLLSTDWMEYSWTLSIYTVKRTSNHIIFLIYHNISSILSKSCCSSNSHWIITTTGLSSYWFASLSLSLSYYKFSWLFTNNNYLFLMVLSQTLTIFIRSLTLLEKSCILAATSKARN